MNEYYYSTNQEDYSYSEIEEALAEALEGDYLNYKYPQTVHIYRGEPVKRKNSDFISGYFVQNISEAAHDLGGEHSEDYCSSIEAKEKEIVECISIAFDAFCGKNNISPNFWGIKNVKTLEIEVLDEDINYKIIGEK